MGPQTHSLFRRAGVLGASAGTTFFAALAVLAPGQPAAAQAGCTRVMGQSTTTPTQLAGWFATSGRRAKLDVSVVALATMFIEEGAREGVRGDIAFAQCIVETGYFGFSPSVPPELHNYSGLGATGGGVKGAGFPDARTGVRAQVQHLRAYADPSLRSAADLTWRARLQPTPAGWVDLALGVPVLNTSRVRRELGWAPRLTAAEALLDLLSGFADAASLPTPPLGRLRPWRPKPSSVERVPVPSRSE